MLDTVMRSSTKFKAKGYLISRQEKTCIPLSPASGQQLINITNIASVKQPVQKSEVLFKPICPHHHFKGPRLKAGQGTLVSDKHKH